MKVVIVEDNKQILRNTRRVLDGDPGITVSGFFTTAEAALEALPLLSPTMLLTDIGLPGMSGIEFITRVKEARPDVEIIAYSAKTGNANLLSALNAGAIGYILKGCKSQDLLEALHCLHEGHAVLHSEFKCNYPGVFLSSTF
jgi:DNA-binding NarL/FixJ family response regulator